MEEECSCELYLETLLKMCVPIGQLDKKVFLNLFQALVVDLDRKKFVKKVT